MYPILSNYNFLNSSQNFGNFPKNTWRFCGKSSYVARHFKCVGSFCMVRNKKAVILLSIFHQDLGFSHMKLNKAESCLRANEIVSASPNCIVLMNLILCLDPYLDSNEVHMLWGLGRGCWRRSLSGNVDPKSGSRDGLWKNTESIHVLCRIICILLGVWWAYSFHQILKGVQGSPKN